tara:strand:+ start:1556 stop:3037 length:1482 start_codon:yes stop_codon:yes gene_type:complete
MLNNQQIDRSPEWHKADEENRSNQPNTTKESFDGGLEKTKLLGTQYCPFAFRDQQQWVTETFYSVNQGTTPQYKRLFPDGSPDDFIPQREIHGMLQRKYGDKLQPLLNHWALYYIPSTAGERYNPSTTDQFIDVDYTRYRNSYRPSLYSQKTTSKTRPTHWQEYLDRLMPREHNCTDNYGKTFLQQDYFEAFIAQRLQQPSQPPLIAVLLRGEQGTGKNYWMDNIMRPLLGTNNFKAVSLSDITGKFTSDLYSTVLVHIEEINDTRGKAAEKLKKLITEDTARTEAKNQNAKVVNKYFGIVASSNVQDPVRIEANDRRYFVPVYSTHKENADETKSFFVRFTDWLETEGLQELADYFYSLDISGFNFRYPPHTADKEELTEVSTTAEDLTTNAAMEIGNVYKNHSFAVADVVSTWRISQSSAKKALKLAGFIAVKRRWTSDPNPTNRWVHKNLNPDGKSWDQVQYKLFTSRDFINPTINYKSMYDKDQSNRAK